MQKIIYHCDQCEKEIGNNKHLSIVLAHSDACGVANPPQADSFWKIVKFPRGFLHFCSAKCIGSYFGALLKQSKYPNLTKGFGKLKNDK